MNPENIEGKMAILYLGSKYWDPETGLEESIFKELFDLDRKIREQGGQVKDDNKKSDKDKKGVGN